MFARDASDMAEALLSDEPIGGKYLDNRVSNSIFFHVANPYQTISIGRSAGALRPGPGHDVIRGQTPARFDSLKRACASTAGPEMRKRARAPVVHAHFDLHQHVGCFERSRNA